MSCCGGRFKKYNKLSQIAKHGLLTAANVVAHAASTGNITADKTIVEKRLALCKKCRHLDGRRCTVCACFINIKAGLKAANCPLKKW